MVWSVIIVVKQKKIYFEYRNRSERVQPAPRDRAHRTGPDDGPSVLPGHHVPGTRVPLSVVQDAGAGGPDHSVLFHRREGRRRNGTLLQVRARIVTPLGIDCVTAVRPC